MARIFFLTNAPTPYQLDFFDELGRHHAIAVAHLFRELRNLTWDLASRPWLEELAPGLRGSVQLLARLRSFRPDIVLIGGYSLPGAERCKWSARALGARVYYWLERPSSASRWKAAARSLVLRTRLSSVDGVLCVGSLALEAYRPFARRVGVLPYAIAPERYAPRATPRAPGPIRFLFAGQYITRKGLPELLEAFRGFGPDEASLTLAGSGPLAHLVEAASRAQSNVRDAGFVAPPSLPSVFAEHDVFVLPSRHDGWAVVVAEALASGLPVISTLTTGATAELVRDGVNGQVCTTEAGSISRALRRYVQDPELVTAHAHAARATFLSSAASAPVARAALESFTEVDVGG